MITTNEQKVLAATYAIDSLIKDGKIFSGMKIGLGTGSTAMPAVKRLAERIGDGTLKDIKAVSTSFQTTLACEELGIPVFTLNDRAIAGQLDLTVDGADEIGPDNTLVKGGGAALLREKITAYSSREYAIVADESKAVTSHGTKFPLPVEIIADARVRVILELEKLGASCTVREGVRKAGPVITDNGNMIVDCLWEKPVDPVALEDAIDAITGVVECGFFTKLRPVAFIAHADGSVEVKK
ncbi:MAG TPA: ribose 5-phosphate isomerase A [Treponema sp.]|nr:ribose 5-phosphate isomerase A [Treponema sp.]